MVTPLTARRLSTLRFYRRRRKRLEFKKGMHVLKVVRAHRFRLAAVIGSIALLFVELGFLLGVLVQRGRGC